MSKPILQKTSFGLIRTNPKLTSNIKLLVDSKDALFLESFDATPELSKSKYKGFKVSSAGDYYWDAWRFYNQSGTAPIGDAFKVIENSDSLSILDKFGLQYDTTYCSGMEAKNSLLYDEEFSMFSPLWIEPTNIPDYFIIFKTKGPATIGTTAIGVIGGTGFGTTLSSQENDPTIIDATENPSNFTSNILDHSEILTSFDLTTTSNLGRYIRKHVHNKSFPESSVIAKWEKGRYFEYNGISLDEPGFVSRSQELFYDTWPNDKTIIEYESIITGGFQNNKMVHPNLINLEFLFDDPNSDDYTFNRYWGLYVNKEQFNTFRIDGSSLFADRFNQPTQLPIPTQDIIGYADNIQPQVQTNSNGIVVYSQPTLTSLSPAGSTVLMDNAQLFQKPRIGYVHDASGQFHKIQNDNQFTSTTLRLDETTVDWKNFSGFQNPEQYVSAEFNLKWKGRPCASIEFVDQPDNDDEFRIYFTDPNDPAQLQYIDFFTITASNSLPPEQVSSNLYSSVGSMTQVATAFAQCVNDTNKYFPDLIALSAVSIGTKVIIYSRVMSSSWNKVKLTSFCNTTFQSNIPIKLLSGFGDNTYTQGLYSSSPGPSFQLVVGWLANGQFQGGNDNPKARIKISSQDTTLLTTAGTTGSTAKYLITDNDVKQYSRIESIIPYMDEPVYDSSGQVIDFTNAFEYRTVNIQDTNDNISLTSGQQASIVEEQINSCGLLSFYPVKDFDFDFYSTQYMKEADASRPDLRSWYYGSPTGQGLTGPYGGTSSFSTSATFNSGTGGATYWINAIIGPSAPFVENGGFQGLMGISDIIDDTDSTIYNEYDRLKENELQQLSLDSRVVPFVSKWCFDDDGLDVRQNPYRLDASPAFRYPNFGPSHREFIPNTKFYTHEWPYLQKYPPYMDFETRKNSFSYFDSPLVLGATYSYAVGTTESGITAWGLRTVEGSTALSDEQLDYFTNYFTREDVGGTAINKDIKYSTFAYATDQRYAETFFRGAKVVVKPRVETSNLNFNVRQKKFVKNTKYNDYKFAAVISLVDDGITFRCIENEKYKTITIVIEAGLRDNLFTKLGAAPIGSTAAEDYFIDRTLLYTMKDSLQPTGGTSQWAGATAYEPSDFSLSGAIHHFEGLNNVTGGVTVFGTVNGEPYPTPDPLNPPNFYGNGSVPNFVAEMQPNQDGGYNDVEVPYSPNPGWFIRFSGITVVAQNSFNCTTVGLVDSAGTVINPPDLWSNVFYPWTQGALLYSTPQLWSQTPIYRKGGFRGYEGMINEMTFANMAHRFNSGDPSVEYITYKENGDIKYNDKVLNLTRPIEAVKANYLKPVEDTVFPQELDQTSTSGVIGYKMSAATRATVNVMARYDGRYQPKFKDIFFYSNEIPGATTLTLTGYPFNRNLQFNTNDSTFGLIENYFFNKVNTENPQGVLNLNTSTSQYPVYPKISEIAIDKRNMYSFLSNWDIDYYRKYEEKSVPVSQMGYRGTKEQKAFFGSKIISIPDAITLENFTIIDLSDLDGGISNIQNVSESTVKTIESTSNTQGNDTTSTTNNKLILDVFSTKALTQYLRADGFDSEFNKWINPLFSFGESGLDDDIENYIAQNIFDRYTVKRVIFYESTFANNRYNLETVETTLTNLQLLQKDFAFSENCSIKFSTESDLNFRLIYNIPKLDNYSISWKVELVKK